MFSSLAKLEQDLVDVENPYGCLSHCAGVSATVTKKPFQFNLDKQLENVISNYFKLDQQLFLEEEGRKRFSTVNNFFSDRGDKEKMKDLKIVRITFNSPMLLHITSDVKINFVGKLSAIGGTLGLFTGFSVMSFVEIVYWITKLAVELCSGFLFGHRNKRKVGC